MKLSEVAMAFTYLAENYPNFKSTESKVRMWHMVFGALEKAVFYKAVQQHLLNQEQPPTIAHIKKAVVSLADIFPSALDAWSGEVKKAISHYSIMDAAEAYESMNLVTKKAVRQLGGWAVVCMSDNEDILRNSFCKVYEGIKALETEKELLPGGSQLLLVEGDKNG